MIFLPPMQMAYDEAYSGSTVLYENGLPFDFTGYSGTWAITRAGVTKLTGVPTLSNVGAIGVTITAANVDTLQPTLQTVGFTLPGTTWTATVTNGTRTIVFYAAIQLFRNKTTVSPYAVVVPGWVF